MNTNFQKFCHYFTFWQKEFGLNKWQIKFVDQTKSHKDLDYLAMIRADNDNKSAMVFFAFGKNNPNSGVNQDVESMAIHECLHLLFEEMLCATKEEQKDSHKFTKLIASEAEESVVLTLEKVIFNGVKK